MINYGANTCISVPDKDASDSKSVFTHFMKTVPDECKTVLTHFVEKNNFSLTAKDLEISISFQLWETECEKTELDGLLKVVHRGQLDLLKHPVVETFLHLKHLRVGRMFNFADLVMYIVFLTRKLSS